MKYSTRCSVAIHCMFVIALFGQEERLTSALIAKSTGCNATTIRSIFQQLQQAELIIVRRGTGGAILGREPGKITIWDIYSAVQPQEDRSPLRIHANPYAHCPVGRRIQEILAEPYQRIGEAMQGQMQAYTLTMLLRRYEELGAREDQIRQENTTDAG